MRVDFKPGCWIFGFVIDKEMVFIALGPIIIIFWEKLI